jgi:hypothetical protein
VLCLGVAASARSTSARAQGERESGGVNRRVPAGPPSSVAPPAGGPPTRREPASPDRAPGPRRRGPGGGAFLRAAANVVAINYLVWQYDWLIGEDWARHVSPRSIGRNVNGGFEWDNNALATNFSSHPYHGSLYFAGARAAGLSFWQSAPYAFLGSLSWELLAETEPPSRNDLVATSFGGVLLGEILYRLSSEILDDRDAGFPRLAREAGAAVVSPMRGANRLIDGDAWRAGAAPRRKGGLRVRFSLGADRVRSFRETSARAYAPSAFGAVEVEYGDLAPPDDGGGFEPFDFFEIYAAANLLRDDLTGTQVTAQGLLYGRSTPLDADDGGRRANAVLGLAQSAEFQDANLVKFGALNLGPANYVVWRFGPRRRLRLGTDVGWTALAGISTPYANDVRDYNYATGAAFGVSLRYDLGRFGEVGARARQYVAYTFDGHRGRESLGYARASFDVGVLPNVGLGVAPRLVARRATYDDGDHVRGWQVDAQIYVSVHD